MPNRACKNPAEPPPSRGSTRRLVPLHAALPRADREHSACQAVKAVVVMAIAAEESSLIIPFPFSSWISRVLRALAYWCHIVVKRIGKDCWQLVGPKVGRVRLD